MMRASRVAIATLLGLGITACKDVLTVVNPNNPNRAIATARPDNVEALIGASYQILHSATLGAYCAINTQSMSLSMENGSNLSNNQTGPRAALPRVTIDNTRGNPGASGNFRDYQFLNRAARQAATGLAAVNAPGFTFFPFNAAQTARAQAVAHFVIGASLGNLALIYDQGSIISWTDNPAQAAPPPLTRYDTLMTYALNELDSSMHYDSLASASLGASIGATNWFGNPGIAASRDSMVTWAEGMKARFMAGVSRDTTSRNAVNWAKVITYTTDFLNKWCPGTSCTPPNTGGVILQLLPSSGFDVGYLSQLFAGGQNAWSMEWQFIVGMADTSGGYATWIGQAPAAKTPFLVVTGDKRFPSGTTRAAQQGVGQGTSSTPMPSGVYIRNRSSPDWTMDPWGTSFYDYERLSPLINAVRIGPYPIMPAAEMRLLRAEAEIRTGNLAGAAADINVTRVANGLPAATATARGTAQGILPGCIPKVPSITAALTGTVACPDIWEMMKWEKRLETQFTAPYAWYLDSRGWGDLVLNTATEWPTPYQEIDTRQLFEKPPYPGPYGGGAANSAALGTYGLR